MSLIVFIFILSLLILVHEWGHFIIAKKCGVKIEQFALGFGPKLLGWEHDGCQFCLCAVPLGGFVKMAGDEREKCSGSRDEYFSKPAGQRALIILMGPVVNLILAYACFWIMFMIGYVDIDLSSQRVSPVVGQVLEHSPAQEAGLKLGDRILKINGFAIDHWSQLQDLVSNSTSNRLTLTIERANHDITIGITAQETDNQDIFGRLHKVRRIGVGPIPINNTKDVIVMRYGFLESFVKAGEELRNISVKTYEALYEMAIGARSPKEAMGIIGMFFVIKFALTIGFSFLLHIVGILSASLAIFNLLPVMPLDGGHLFLICLEKLRGRALSVKADQFIAKAGFALIIMLALFVFYSDFERIGLIDKIIKLFKGTGL
ncbi:MAG: site-2 protease family protein [Candidatus Omnitrophica bacterium]|nr:site-2 protease family protein [Candidatus Omnitrophota bacterium]